VLVLDVEAAVLADVAEVRRDGLHAAAAAGHLDHDLRRTSHGSRFDAFADRSRSPGEVGDQPRLRRHLDDAIAGIEQALTPLNEGAVDALWLRHVHLPGE
jgi:hypothetical protein